MIPVNLQLKNFMSYQNANLSFESFDLAVFSGINGAGKSTLLEALTWVVWGKTRAGEDADSLIYQGESEMWVEYIFNLDKNHYRIIRKRKTDKNAKTTLILQIAAKSNRQKIFKDFDWQNLSEATIKETQEKIIQVLHLTYEIFINSSYLQQGKADEFTIKAPAKRKEILSQILNLNYYDHLQELSKEKRRQASLEKENASFKIEQLESIIVEEKICQKEFEKSKKDNQLILIKLKDCEKKINEMLTDKQKCELIKNKKKNLTEKWTNIAHEIKNSKDEIESCQKELRLLENLVKSKKETDAKYQFLKNLQKEERELQTLKDQISELKEKQASLQAHEQHLKEDVEKIKHISTCPTCLRKMSSEEAKKIISQLKMNFMKKYGMEIEALQNKISKLAYEPLKHHEITKRVEDLRDIVEIKQEIDKAQIKKEGFQKTIQKENLNIQKDKTEIAKITKEGKRLNEEISKLEKKIKNFEMVNFEYNHLKDESREVAQKLGQLLEKINQIKRAKQDKEKAEKDYLISNEREMVFGKLSEIFGKNGIQSMIIEQTLPAIEEEANKILSQISKDLRVNFLTRRAKKTGEEMMETLDIQITDGLGQRNYELFSGGEAFRINFAIRIAISQILSNRSGAKLQFLAIDEGFGALDQAGKEELVSAISSIREKFDKIVVITHLEELKEVFPNRVEVTKNEEGSQIHLVA